MRENLDRRRDCLQRDREKHEQQEKQTAEAEQLKQERRTVNDFLEALEVRQQRLDAVQLDLEIRQNLETERRRAAETDQERQLQDLKREKALFMVERERVRKWIGEQRNKLEQEGDLVSKLYLPLGQTRTQSSEGHQRKTDREEKICTSTSGWNTVGGGNIPLFHLRQGKIRLNVRDHKDQSA